MTDNNYLLDAVEQLTKPRIVHTTITNDDTGEWLGVHSEQHPPLLILLLEGTGITRSAASSDIKLPIDADALEMWGQVRDLIKLWCKKLHAPYQDSDLTLAVTSWYIAHTNAVRAGTVSATTDEDVTRMVQGWVRMIESKFDPQEKREWKNHCVADITNRDEHGLETTRRCGARRILIDGSEGFAIQLNVTTLTAECRRCHTKWVGEKELATLRFLTNLDVAIREGKEVDHAARALIGG